MVAYFWSDVVRYVGAWFGSVARRSVKTTDERLAWGVFFATIPAAIAGAVGEDTIETHLGQPWQIAIFLAVFAVLLWIADRRPQRRDLDDLSIGPAFWIGISQILALMPGVSRSGITITTGRFSGLDRDAAARFSFLLLIPIVFGAVLYKGVKHVLLDRCPLVRPARSSSALSPPPRSGSIAIDLLLGYVRRHGYTLFVIYRLALAAAIVS